MTDSSTPVTPKREEWAVETRFGRIYPAKSREDAEKRADNVERDFWKQHRGVPGAAMLEPQPLVVHRWVTPWAEV